MHPWQLHCLTIVTRQLQLPVRRKFRSIWSNIVGISNPTPTISTSRNPCSSSTSVGEYSSDIRLRVVSHPRIVDILLAQFASQPRLAAKFDQNDKINCRCLPSQPTCRVGYQTERKSTYPVSVYQDFV